MVRRGMRSLIENTDDLAVCGEAATAENALAVYEREHPDVVCLDLMLGNESGLGLIGSIRKRDPKARVLVLSVKEEDVFAERCLQAGASGYAMKTEPNESLLTALRRVAKGEVHVSPRIAVMFLNRVPKNTVGKSGIETLTERELQVFKLVGLSLTTRQIAERLGIGIKTVETHRENIKNKLGLEHAPALVRKATMWVHESF